MTSSPAPALGPVISPVLPTCIPVAGHPCIDCGGVTWCGMAHGAGHDHSLDAAVCTAEALGVMPPEDECQDCGSSFPGLCC